MLKKTAGTSQEIMAILDGAVTKLFGAIAKAERADDMIAQNKAEKATNIWANYAVEGLTDLLVRVDSIAGIKYSDVGTLFGTKSPEKVWEAATQVAGSLSSMSREQYISTLEDIARLFLQREKFVKAGGSAVLDKIMAAKKPAKVSEPKPAQEQKEVPKQESPNADNPSTSVGHSEESWYVSAELNPDNVFRQGSQFYGPFENKIEALVFSLLVNNSSGQERSVALGGKIAGINGIDLSLATIPGSATVGNRFFAGEIDSAMATYLATKKRSNLAMPNISPSGELFEYFVEFVSINCAFSDPGNPHMSEITDWYRDREQGIAVFPEFYYNSKGKTTPNVGSSKDLDPIDSAIHGAGTGTETEKEPTKRKGLKVVKVKESPKDPTKTVTVKDTAPAPEALVNSIPTASIEGISIFSPEDPDRLVGDLSLQYIEELRAAAKGLATIGTDQISHSVDQCIDQLDSFFASVMSKDNAINKQVLEFRERNPLNIVLVTPSWEFRNNFSLSNMISKDKEIIGDLSQFIGRVAYFKRLDRSYPNIKQIIDIKLKEYKNRPGSTTVISREEAEEITVQISSSIITDIIAKMPGVLLDKLSKESEHNTYSGVRVNKFTEKVIYGVNIDPIVMKHIAGYFSTKETVTKEITVKMVKCGVCDQVFSVPKEHASALEKFDKGTENYSFFRGDNSLITEDELIGDPTSPKVYTLDQATLGMLVGDTTKSKKVIRRTMRGGEVTGLSQNVKASFTWLEVNKMIYSPSGIKDQIDGQIVRNFILKTLGGTPSGGRGIFTNKTLCASTLYNLTEDMKVTNKDYIEKNDNYACRASSMATYDAAPTAKPYQASSYIMPFGNSMRSKETEKYPNRLGYMFSRSNVRCPCYIGPDSKVLSNSISFGGRSYQGQINFVAVPKLPPSALSNLNEALMFKESDLYSAPTKPDGELASGLPAAYVVCGRNTSISMFDRDPASPNFIQTFFKNMLATSGIEALTKATKLMLSYGIEMNDIKPHLEVVLAGQGINTASRREILQSLLKTAKISVAQEVLQTEVGILGNLGIVCEHGHKFTIQQSWDFASTHFAIKLRDSDVVKSKELKSIIENPFQALINSTKISTFRIVTDEAALRSGGFRQPSEILSLNELKQLMLDKRLYFKSDDGAMYVISDPRFFGLDNAPWVSGKIGKEKQFSHTFWQFGATSSQTMETEDGGRSQGDIEDVAGEGGEEALDNSRAAKQSADLDFAEVIMPDISEVLKDSIVKNAQSAFEARSAELAKNSNNFVDDLTRTLTLCRSWGTMAADYQIDFMRGGNPPLVRDPTLKVKIAETLDLISSLVGLKTEDYEADFYSRYDLDALLSEQSEVGHDKFLSLATIAQWYEGFSVPFIANLKAAEAKAALIGALKVGIARVLPTILVAKSGKQIVQREEGEGSVGARTVDVLSATVASSAVESIAEQLAVLLLSPYDNLFAKPSDYKYLMEKAVADYTGRAYVFSFAIDMMDKLNTFFSRYFFNEESSLYIGPFPGVDKTAMDILNDMFRTEQVRRENINNLLIMDETDFKDKLSRLRASMSMMYRMDQLFTPYMNHKKIVVSREENQLLAQKAVVAMKFAKLLGSASSSIGSIIQDLSEKPLNSPSLKKAAVLLDSVSDVLIKQRDPINYEKLKGRLDKSSERFEDREHVFEQNAAGFARINLNSLNVGLGQIAYLDKNIRAIAVMPAALSPDYFSLKTVSGITLDKMPMPCLYFLKKILVETVAGTSKHRQGRIEGNKELYICAIPQDATDFSMPNGFRLTNYLNFDGKKVVDLDSKQGKEFVARYVRGVDPSQTLILIDPNLLDIKTKAAKIGGKEILPMVLDNLDTSVRVSKIYDPISSWPPPNNLLYNNYDIARNPSSDMIESRTFKANLQHEDTVRLANEWYAQNTNIENHADFVTNITKFPQSIGSKTADVSSTHGVIIPLNIGDLEEEKKLSALTNTVVQDDTNIRADTFSISKAALRIRTDSEKVLDMGWAFKALDPQFYNEDGKLRSRLIQSGAVQKLEYISVQMAQIYNWIMKNAKGEMWELLESTFHSYEEFLSTFFSPHSTCVRLIVDIPRSVKTAEMTINLNSLLAIWTGTKDIALRANELMGRLIKLVDFYNCSQLLNAECSRLIPQLQDVNSIDLGTKREFKSLSLKLLDPLSLWKIITNPAMSTTFGGPINPANIDDYKAFVVATFGINDLVGKVCVETGLSPNEISVEDMFDMPKFCERYISKYSKDAAITKFIAMFKLATDEDGNIRTYINGYPMIFEHSIPLAKTMASLDHKQFKLHESSYVEHICRTQSMFETMTAAEMKDPVKMRRMKDKIIALQNGTETATLDELVSFALQLRKSFKRYYPKGKDADTRKAGDMEALRAAVLDIANRIYKGPKKIEPREAKQSISWRKIGQAVSDDGGSIDLRGLYEELQQRFLNAMAEMAG